MDKISMNQGSYQIMVAISADVAFSCGALGEISLGKGLYVYTGSAMRGLDARVARHRRKEKKLRWHIDYLLAQPNSAIVEIRVFPSPDREECVRNRILTDGGAVVPIVGFGSSDCRECPSHLVRVTRFPPH